METEKRRSSSPFNIRPMSFIKITFRQLWRVNGRAREHGLYRYSYPDPERQFNSSSYGGLYGRTDDDKTYMAPKAGDCGGCSSPCTPKCVAEKGSRKMKALI
ncbi:hypothetical protein DAPPUDRAFT_250360 [Daphnia pulex]|uniref:Uncharacterized protein n=1 Tax=Daphnia pulex TaxID=6669 RepID=E9GYE2_DAPPU|nr:hypothetical protein DAPPUDRAFT_250360 [Daphnia pulex]|eukprot:EFX75491.1 hypothetical protein DAPPUDRAFT_250360 [Daphnia pulex]